MLKADAITFWQQNKACQCRRSETGKCCCLGILVPEGRAMRLQEASGGELQYDPKVYDEYRKTKRAGRLNNENHS